MKVKLPKHYDVWVLIPALLIWLGPSLIFLFQGNADLFQRFGALGVCLIILALTIQRGLSAEARISYFETSVESSLRAIVSYIRFHDNIIRTISGTEAKAVDEVQEKRAQEVDNIDEIMESFHFARRRQYAALESLPVGLALQIAEGVLLFLATLQWGFGDLFVTILIKQA